MKRVILITVAVLFCFCTVSFADNDTKDYVPAPPGTAVMAMYFNHITGNKLYNDGEKITEDANLSANVGIIRPIYYTQIGRFTIDPQMLFVFGEQSLDLGPVEIASTGIADPIIACTFWFLNNPETQTWMGFTPFITIPIGNYDEEKGALNLGANRWALKSELGFVKGFDKFFLDLTANVEFYGDNDDFGANDQTLEKDPLFTFETHLSYNFTDSFFTSFDYYYHNGGETTLNDDDQKDAQDNHIAGLTLGFMLSPSYQLMLKYRNEFEVESGFQTNTFGLRMLYIW